MDWRHKELRAYDFDNLDRGTCGDQLPIDFTGGSRVTAASLDIGNFANPILRNGTNSVGRHTNQRAHMTFAGTLRMCENPAQKKQESTGHAKRAQDGQGRTEKRIIEGRNPRKKQSKPAKSRNERGNDRRAESRNARHITPIGPGLHTAMAAANMIPAMIAAAMAKHMSHQGRKEGE